jgi:hypothetical protein
MPHLNKARQSYLEESAAEFRDDNTCLNKARGLHEMSHKISPQRQIFFKTEQNNNTDNDNDNDKQIIRQEDERITRQDKTRL